jgi:YegS/Rv2252/BmrU family lipid kinase
MHESAEAFTSQQAMPASEQQGPAERDTPARSARGRISVITNQRAGSGRAEQLLKQVGEGCRALGLDADVQAVQSGEQISDAAARAVRSGAGVVVAAGGDGTVSAVASCLVGTGIPLGVLPLGTLNHFAKDLSIPMEVDAALEVIARGSVREIDVAEVNGRVFINNSSLGLYPHIVRHRELQQQQGRSKWTALLTATLHVLQRDHPMWLQIEVDGRQMVRRTGFVFIGNNSYCMEGLEIGKRASLTSGCLSLSVTRTSHRLSLLRLALRALFGRLQEAEDFDLVEATTVTVRTRRGHVRVAADGEVTVMESPLHYRTLPAALRVLAPPQD